MANLLEEIRAAFDGSEVPRKNILLRRAHDEIEQLRKAMGDEAQQFMQALVDEASREKQKRRAAEKEAAAMRETSIKNAQERNAALRERDILRQALEDVANPLAHLRRYAEENDAELSGGAHAIANNLGFVQQIARSALDDATKPTGAAAIRNMGGEG